jgi:hypothetical protein
MVKQIKQMTKNTEHLRFVRHGLNDVIVNDTSSKSFCTKINMKKIRIFYLKDIC